MMYFGQFTLQTRSVYDTHTIRCVFLRSLIRFDTDRKPIINTRNTAVNVSFLQRLRIVNGTFLVDLGFLEEKGLLDHLQLLTLVLLHNQCNNNPNHYPKCIQISFNHLFYHPTCQAIDNNLLLYHLIFLVANIINNHHHHRLINNFTHNHIIPQIIHNFHQHNFNHNHSILVEINNILHHNFPYNHPISQAPNRIHQNNFLRNHLYFNFLSATDPRFQ